MVFIRPATPDDVGPLADLAAMAGVGLTTLPKDRDLLARRVQKSCRGFDRIPDHPGGESYLFVLQDGEGGPVVGASGVVSKVGGFEPFYAFRLCTEVHACDVLNVRTAVPYLELVREHDGPCEIGSLFLHPDYRGRDCGRLLQLVRFLFLAEHPAAFEPTVVSELRGSVDADDRCPFWDAVGRHFFDIDFARADYLSVVNKRFIADLMPRHPIYVPLLPAAGREAIGKPQDASRPALRNLQAEGFAFSGMIDIFDGGPVVSCDRDAIRTVRQSRVGVVREIAESPLTSAANIIGTRAGPFRACAGGVEAVDDDGVRIDAAVARTLGVAVGSPVRYAPLRPPTVPDAGLPAAGAAAANTCATPDREGSD